MERKAGDCIRKGYWPITENERVRVIGKYSPSSYLLMSEGDCVVDESFGLNWEVLSNDGTRMVIKQRKSQDDDDFGATMMLTEDSCNMSFLLLEKIEE